MNKFLLVALFNTLLICSSFAKDFTALADSFFKKNVSGGLVNYKVIESNPAELNELVEMIANSQPDDMKGNTRKAFLINTYNILVIKNVINHSPINSPVAVGSFFQGDKFNIGGKKIDLNTLENKILRPEYKDPRLHFVLVCGAVSCPPITNFAYTADKLEEQLNMQTTAAMNNSSFIKVDAANKKVEISEIFKWYASDFRLQSKKDIEYINKYRVQEIPSDYKVVFYKYDWKLNGIETISSTSSSITPVSEKSVIQTLTPSALLKKGQWDASVFNNIYTQTTAADHEGVNKSSSTRNTFFASTLKFNYGISKNARMNIGVIGTFRSTYFHKERTSSPTEVFGFGNENKVSRTGFSSIAPAFKFTPFKKISNFSVQTSLSVPLISESEGNSQKGTIWLDRNGYFWNNQFFFDKSFHRDLFQIFAEIDFGYSFEGDTKSFFDNSLTTPISLFFSYFPTSKITFYVQGQHAPTWWINDKKGQLPYIDFTQAGIGGKYQLTNSLNIEILLSDFFRGRSNGTGETYNLGLRYVFL